MIINIIIIIIIFVPIMLIMIIVILLIIMIIEDASRDRRPSKVVAAGDRASECTFFAQGVRKLSSEKQCRSNFCQHITRFYAKNASQKSFQKYRKSIPNHSQNRRKTCPEAPGSSPEHQRSNRWTFLSIFLRIMA